MRPLIVLAVLATGALTACSAGPRDAMDVATRRLEHGVSAVSQALRLDATGPYHQAVGRDPGLLGRASFTTRRSRARRGATRPGRASALKGQGADALSAGRMVVKLSPQLDAQARQDYESALQSD